MARYILFFLCLLTYLSVQSYAHEDSMMRIATPAINTDTAHIRTYIRVAKDIQRIYPDSARQMLYRGLEMSRATGYVQGIVLCFFQLGYIDYSQQLYDGSLKNYSQALLYGVGSMESKYKVPEILNNMGMVYVSTGNYAGGMKYFSQALLSSSALPTHDMEVGILNNIALTLRLSTTAGAAPDKQILHYLETAEQSARKQNNYALLTSILNNKGIFYGQGKNWKKSLEVLQESLEYTRKYNIINTRIAALNNIATVHLENSAPQKALPLLKEALTVAGTQDSSYHVATLQTLGEAYYQLGDWNTSEKMLLQALSLSKRLEFKRVRPDIYLVLSNIYKKKNDPAKALAHFEAYTKIRDSLTNKEVARNVHQLEVKYRTSEKDKQLILKEFRIVQQQNEIRNKNLWIAGSAAGVLVLVSFLFSAYRSSRHKQRLQAQQIHNLKQSQEIMQLKATMKGEDSERRRIARELHDGIVGQLSAIRMRFGAVRDGQNLQNNSEYAEALHDLDNATKELRKTAHNLMPEILLQIGVVNAIRAHCNKLNHGDIKPTVHCYLADDVPKLEPEFELSLYRIVQELIQNGIKHAHAQKIIVQLDYNDGLLALTVEDDGVGIGRQTSQNGGMGLDSVRSRVHVMNGNMSISSSPGEGTAIYLEFNLMQSSEKNLVKL